MDASNEDLVRAVDAEKRAELAEMIEVLTEAEHDAGDFGWLFGVEVSERTARWWCEAMDAHAAAAWIAVGGFDPDRLADLIAAGYTVEDFLTTDPSVPSVVIGVPGPWNGQRTLLCPDEYGTLVYAWCNRDITLIDLGRIVEAPR